MDRKTLLAFVLSGLILLGYTLFVNKYYPPPPPPPPSQTETVETKNPPAPQIVEPAVPAPKLAPLLQVHEASLQVRARLFTTLLSNRGAVASEWILNRLPDGREIQNVDGGVLELLPGSQRSFDRSFRLEVVGHPELTALLSSSNWAFDGGDQLVLPDGARREVTFSLSDGTQGLQARKTYIFGEALYQFQVRISVIQNGQNLPVELVVGPGFGDQAASGRSGYGSSPPQAVAYLDGKLKRINGKDLHQLPTQYPASNGGVRWAALTDHYFAVAVKVQEPSSYVRFANVEQKEKDAKTGKDLDHNFLTLSIPVAADTDTTVFVGPKDRLVLDRVSQEWGGGTDLGDLIDYGMLSFMVKPLIPVISWGLSALNALFGNYGWSIIVFTIIINVFLFPLRWKSSVAMKKAQKMQPQMKALQEKMKKVKKEDPEYQKLQAEQIQLMKEGNPLGGCLPLLLQMPIFWAIFVMLTISLEVRHAAWFGWIHDLSAADPWHVLPVIMCITMVAQSALTPTPTDSQQKMQKTMMTWVMPVALTAFFFWSAPSGLVLYWMFSNIVGVGQQFLINKLA